MNRLAAWRDSMLVKSLMLLLLLGVLCIPLWQIENLIDARGDSQQAARDELALTHVGPQKLIGPLLVGLEKSEQIVPLGASVGEIMTAATFAASAEGVEIED